MTISQTNGQDFYKFSGGNTYNSYADALSNGKVFLLTMHTNSYYSLGGGVFPKYEDFLNEISGLIYDFNKLYLLNDKLSIEKELNFQSTLDSINWVLNFQVDEPDDEMVVFVANLMTDTTKFYMHWYNLELELQHSLPIAAEYNPLASLFFGWHFIINNDNNIVYTGKYGFHEFDRYGTEINVYYATGNEVYGPPSPYIVQSSLGGYFSTEPQLFNYTSFNPDLSLIEGVGYYAIQEPRRSVRKDCKRLALDNNKENAYITGFVRIREPCDTASIGLFQYAEFVYKYDLIEPGVPSVFFVDTTNQCNYNRYGQFAINLFYDDHIYYSHSDKDCGFIAPPGADPTCYETYITLKCLDNEGNLRWKKYLGGDAAYLPQGVVATPDSGVVVFVLRHHPDENKRFAADIYVAKFDKHGNPVNLPNAGLVPISEVELNTTIKVFPNPVTNYIYIEGLQPSTKNKIKLYNNVGQLIFNNEVVDNTVNLHHLKKGYYTYAILNNKGLLKGGKILKW